MVIWFMLGTVCLVIDPFRDAEKEFQNATCAPLMFFLSPAFVHKMLLWVQQVLNLARRGLSWRDLLMLVPLDVNGRKKVMISSLYANNQDYDIWLKLPFC